MTTIDLNTITLAEAKLAGVTGMDLITVLRNPVNSEVTKKNAEVAERVAQIGRKPARVRIARGVAKRKEKSYGKNFNWQDGDKITKLFTHVKSLLEIPFAAWKSAADFRESVSLAMHEIFSAEELAGHTEEHLIERGSHQIILALRAINIITEDADDAADKLNGNDIGSFWHQNFHVVDAAGKAGLISEEEHNTFLNYLESVRYA